MSASGLELGPFTGVNKAIALGEGSPAGPHRLRTGAPRLLLHSVHLRTTEGVNLGRSEYIWGMMWIALSLTYKEVVRVVLPGNQLSLVKSTRPQ